MDIPHYVDLDEHFGEYAVHRQIHDVPPHAVYEVNVDGNRAILKVDTGETGRAGIEGRVIAFVGEHASIPVPEIHAVGDSWFVAAWHPNAPSPADSFEADRTWAAATGRALARLHQTTASAIDTYGRFQLRDGSLTTAGFDDWHAGAIDYVNHYRPTLERYGHGDMAEAVLTYLHDHPEVFAGDGEAVCCHGWATPEHVSVVDGEVGCMIDFEHAIAAPPAFDYWRTVFPAFASQDSPEPQAAFRTGYESIRPLPDGFEDRRPLYGLLNTIYFFESLYVQDQHDPEAEVTIANRLRENIQEILATLS